MKIKDIPQVVFVNFFFGGITGLVVDYTLSSTLHLIYKVLIILIFIVNIILLNKAMFFKKEVRSNESARP